MWDRRSFLQGCVVGLGALASAAASEQIPGTGKDISDLTPEQLAKNEDYWFGIQQAFTEDRNLVNLNNGTIQNGLRIVQDAVRRHSEFSGNAAAYSMGILAKEIESCRRRLASHLGCDSEELVICRGGTEAGQIPIMGLDLQRGDEVITTNQDYPKLINSWRQREKREGIVLKMTQLPAPPVSLDQFYKLVEQQVTPRTKVIHVCHMTHWSGQMAPPGNGFVRIPKEKIPKIWPLTPPGIDDPKDIRRFEDVGTRTPSNRVAIAEAITFNEGIGIERKSARIRYLKERWAHRVGNLPRVHFYSSLDPAESCGVASFGIEGMDMAKLTEHLLDKWGIIVVPVKHPDGWIDGIRAVVNVSLSAKEVDYFADVIENIMNKDVRL